MIRILLNGADGRMGSRIESLCADPARKCTVAWRRTGASGADPGTACDVVIDFSSDAGARDAIALARGRRVPLVSGTTGLTDATRRLLGEASREIPVLHSANTSLGVAVARRLVAEMARVLHRAAGPEFTMEIVETHHIHKLDAPSGTALALADAIGVRGILGRALRPVEDLLDPAGRGDRRPRGAGEGARRDTGHHASCGEP